MSEQTLPFMEPCGHARPQADSQLHGVCVFCYRDRLAESHRKNAAFRKRVAELEALLKRVDDEAMCVTAQLDSDIGAALAVSKRAGGEEDDA